MQQSPTTDTGKTCTNLLYSAWHSTMTLQDVKDTFLHPAIDLLTSGSTGTKTCTYHITTSASTSRFY